MDSRGVRPGRSNCQSDSHSPVYTTSCADAPRLPKGVGGNPWDAVPATGAEQEGDQG